MSIHNGYQDKRIENIEESVKVLNHNSTIMKEDLAEVKTDVSWLKRFFWIIATASIGSLVGILIQLITSK